MMLYSWFIFLVPGKGLGIGFGQSSKSGIFIKYLAKGSIAAKNGSLQYEIDIVKINLIISGSVNGYYPLYSTSFYSALYEFDWITKFLGLMLWRNKMCLNYIN